MKIVKILFVILIISLLSVIVLNTKNLKSTSKQQLIIPPPISQTSSPIASQSANLKPSTTHNHPAVSISQTSRIGSTSCQDGDVMRQGVHVCSDNPVCDMMAPFNDRFCRLPDGTCRFFCDAK